MDENGQVRILDLAAFVYYAPHERKKLEEDAQKYHWDPLQFLFDDLKNLQVPLPYPMRFLVPSSMILAPTPSPLRFMRITLALDFPMRTQPIDDDDKKSRHRKSSKGHRGTSKTITVGTVSLGPKSHSLALSKMPRSVGGSQPPPPSYSEYPLLHARPRFQRVLLAPLPEDTIDGGGSIVEVE